LAIIAFILSMTGILMILPVIGSIAGIILAYQARKQIADTREEGGGLATAAIWIGWIALILVILSTIAFILFFVILAASTSYN
jgi:4-hydroxybenzoate polyprenyltransferase